MDDITDHCATPEAVELACHGHLIGGRQVAPESGTWIDSENPATGRPWARIARGTAADVNRAVADAAAAQADWGRRPPRERAEVVLALADLLQRRSEDLVSAEVADNGKRIAEVRGQLAGLHAWFRPAAEAARSLAPRALSVSVPGVSVAQYRVPFGVVAAITPWNSPLMIAAWKLAPALAAGNAAVLKPSELASVSTLLFAELAGEVLPPGVLNVVTGTGPEVGAPLAAHPGIRKVSFTGSDAGGRAVALEAAAGPWPTVMELGGKAPQVVFADADLDAAVNGVISGIFLSNGQTCVAGARLIVEASLHDRLLERLVAVAESLRPGDPMDPDTEIGPLANRAHRDKVLAAIDRARGDGARLVTGGGLLDVPGLPGGHFVAPTIFTEVTPDMALWREEVFGPVLAVTPFASEEEAIGLATDTEYGLAAAVWTGDPDRGARVAAALPAGTVYVNHYRSVDPGAPIGGMGRSGHGRELGPQALDDWLQPKAVWTGSAPMPDPFPGATQRRAR